MAHRDGASDPPGYPTAFEGLRKTAKSGIELLIADNLPQDRPPTTHEKTTALRAVFELLHHVPSEVAREDYIQIAARLVSVDPQAALRDFKKVPPPRSNLKGGGAPETTPEPLRHAKTIPEPLQSQPQKRSQTTPEP